jgi:hypothetical protein
MDNSKITTGDILLGVTYFLFCSLGFIMSAVMLHVTEAKNGLFIIGYIIFNGCCDVFGIFFGIGLINRKKWTDAILRYIGWLFLLKIPLGTVLGVITIVYEIRRPLQYGGKVSKEGAQETAPEAGRESTFPAGEARGPSGTARASVDKKEINRKTGKLLLLLSSILVPIPLVLVIGMVYIGDFLHPNGYAGAYAGAGMLILFTLAGTVISVAGLAASFLLFNKKKEQSNNTEVSKESL